MMMMMTMMIRIDRTQLMRSTKRHVSAICGDAASRQMEGVDRTVTAGHN